MRVITRQLAKEILFSSGFVLIALATAAGIAVLATLFFKVVRKRKK